MCKELRVSMHRGVVIFGTKITKRLTKLVGPKHVLFGFHRGCMRKQSLFVSVYMPVSHWAKNAHSTIVGSLMLAA